METLETLHKKIETKRNNIFRIERDIIAFGNHLIENEMRDILEKFKNELKELQSQFNEMAKEFN